MNIPSSAASAQSQTNPTPATASQQTRNPLSDDFIKQVKALSKDNQFSREDYKTVLADLKQSGLPDKDIEAVRKMMDVLFDYTDSGFFDNGKLENSEMHVLRKQVDSSGSRAAKQFFNAINDSMKVVEDKGLMAGMTRLLNSTGVGTQDHFKHIVARREIANFEPATLRLPVPKAPDPVPPAAQEGNSEAEETPQQSVDTQTADDQLSIDNEQAYTGQESTVKPVIPFVEKPADEREENEQDAQN